MNAADLARLRELYANYTKWRQQNIAGAFDPAELMRAVPELLAIAEAHERERLVQMDNKAHFDDLLADHARLTARCERLEAAAKTVLNGFSDGVFVRDTRGDYDPTWSIKTLPYLRALAALAAIEQETACDCCGELASACICDSEQETT